MIIKVSFKHMNPIYQTHVQQGETEEQAKDRLAEILFKNLKKMFCDTSLYSFKSVFCEFTEIK